MNNIESFRNAILAALGYAPDTIEPGTLHRFATRDRRGDAAGWAKLFDDGRAGVFGDHRTGATEVWTATNRASLTRQHRAELARQVAGVTAERERQQREQWSHNARRIAEMQAQSVPLVPGDAVTLYLKHRGFGGVWPLPAMLRLHPALQYWHGGEKLGTFPGMLAPLVAPDGQTVAMHRTFLTCDGRKANLPTPKKLTPAAGALAGACIPLFTPKAGCIGIAEGIETAVAAWLASGIPSVAAYCAGNLAAWQWPVGVQRIVVFADADKAGREAAETLRGRVIGAGLLCEVQVPSDDGADWADVWAARQLEVAA